MNNANEAVNGRKEAKEMRKERWYEVQTEDKSAAV